MGMKRGGGVEETAGGRSVQAEGVGIVQDQVFW